MPEHAHAPHQARSKVAASKDAAQQWYSPTETGAIGEIDWEGANLAEVPLRMTTPSDPREHEAKSIVEDGRRSPGRHGSASGATLRGDIGRMVGSVVGEPGTVLPAPLRRDAEHRLGSDFSGVRIHTGPRAEASARAVDAAAYTVGPHIVFGAGRYLPDSRAGRRLLTHELAHVAQQTHSGHTVLARQPNTAQTADDPDKNVSLGALDDSLVTRAGEAVVGEASWTIAKEFLRGLKGGLGSVSPEQQARIDRKFDDFGPLNAAKYAGGYLLGIIIGLGQGLWGLVEALWTLITLPYKVGQFLFVTLPNLAVKYGPRIQQAVEEGGGIKAILGDLLKNPRETWQALRGLADLVKSVALAKVRSFGRGAAKEILALLEEDWYSYGRDIGKIVGRVLFEIILLIASDSIGNVLKGAAEIAGKIAARAVEGAVELLQSAGRVLGKALDWLSSVGKAVSGKAAEIFEKFKVLIGKLRTVLAEMLPELAETGVGGIKAPVPAPKGAAALESRALPTRTSPARVEDLVPPKVHPSNVAKTPPAAPPRAPGSPSRFTDKEILEELADVQRRGKQATQAEAPTAPGMRETGRPKGSPPIESQLRGEIGEVRAGVDPTKPKTPIWVGGQQRIPDVLDSVRKVLLEVKNVTDLGKDLRAAAQIRDYAQWARAKGYTFELVVDTRTKVGLAIEAMERAGELMITRRALL